MKYSVEAEKRDRTNDRKIARISAVSAGVLLLTVLSFIGYSISNPNSEQASAQINEAFVTLDAQLLEQGPEESGAGSPAKATEAKTTPAQMQQVLTAKNSDAHEESGNSSITNSSDPANNPSGTKHASENPFGPGGINGEKYRGSDQKMVDDQNGDPKPQAKTMRQLIAFPSTNNLKSDENCKVILSVLIDPEGNIIGNPSFVKNGSTTNDMSLINQLIKLVKEQARFNKVNTTKNTKEAIVIRITAN